MDAIIINNEVIEILLHISKSLENVYQRLEYLFREKDKPFLTIDEASKYTGFPKNTLYLYTSENRLPYHKTGKRIFFEINDLNDFVINEKNRIDSVDELSRLKLKSNFSGRY